MAGKSVTIDTVAIKAWFENLLATIQDFFSSIMPEETIAVVGIGVGFILFIVGLIML